MPKRLEGPHPGDIIGKDGSDTYEEAPKLDASEIGLPESLQVEKELKELTRFLSPEDFDQEDNITDKDLVDKNPNYMLPFITGPIKTGSNNQ